MKIKLFLAILLGMITSSYAQRTLDTTNYQKYLVITNANDTAVIIGPSPVPINHINRGFYEYDKKGQKTGYNVNPIDFTKIQYEGTDGKITTLKSIMLPKKFKGVSYKSPFMFTLIENSEQDLEKGKIDFYYLRYAKKPSYDGHNLNELNSQIYELNAIKRNSFESEKSIKKIRYYFKDSQGLHRIDNRSHFKHHPSILGKAVFKKMKQSDKNRKQFLLDYFTEYNKKIDNSLEVKQDKL